MKENRMRVRKLTPSKAHLGVLMSFYLFHLVILAYGFTPTLNMNGKYGLDLNEIARRSLGASRNAASFAESHIPQRARFAEIVQIVPYTRTNRGGVSLSMVKNDENRAIKETNSGGNSQWSKTSSLFDRFKVPIWNVVPQESDDDDDKHISEVNDVENDSQNSNGWTDSLTNLIPMDSMNEIFSGLPNLSFPTPFLPPDNNENTSSALNTSDKNFISPPFRKYTIADKSQDGFGPLLPLAERVDDLTGGWGLSYADLAPESPTTPAGVFFLATNLCYAVAGIVLTTNGELVLGTMTELAGGVSWWYHYEQLKNAGKDPASEVRLALLTDYIFAGTALVTGLVYAAMMGISVIPLQALVAGTIAILCLSICWVYEEGLPYIFWHSLWHIFSAYTGYLVGQARIDNLSTVAYVSTMEHNIVSTFLI